MTSQAFEAALDDPDDHASHLHLRKLISRANSGNFNAPAVAEKYLCAFCDTGSTATRRRWIGMALAWMLNKSSSVVEHLQRLRKELQGLGAIILSPTEKEETKIIAGIVIRQGLERGIEYDCFWLSTKVKNSASNFPKDCGSRWIPAFQDFLDTLDELALTDPIADPSIIYPISLVASDEFRWQPSGDGLAIALIQAGIMTVIAPDDLLCDIRFVDIPIAHICDLRSQQSSLFDSQARTTEHEPWDLTIMLIGDAWTYGLDASRRTGDEITILFQHSRDAKEWESCIKEHIKASSRDPALRIHPMMSKSSPINIVPQYTLQSNAARIKKGQKSASQPQASVQIHSSSGSDKSSNHITRGASRSLTRIAQAENSREPKKSVLERSIANGRSYQAVSAGRIPGSAQLQNGVGKDSSEAQQEEQKVLSTQDRRLIRSTQERSEESPKKVEEARRMHQQRNGETTQGVDSFSSVSMSDDMLSASQTKRTRPVVNQATHSNGKLQKVSQATKLRASQQLRPQSDILDLPNEGEEKSDASLEAYTRVASGSRTKMHKKPQKPKVTNHRHAARSKGIKSHTRRKAYDDDDEFVPNEDRSRKQTIRKRKFKSDTVGGSVRPKKRACTEVEEGAQVDQETENPTRSSVAVQKSSRIHSSKSRPLGAKPTEKLPSSICSSRHPLIGGLLGSQLPPKAPTPQFKKPRLPMQRSEQFSTPSQTKSHFVETRLCPQILTDVEKSPTDVVLDYDHSSPTPQGAATSKGRHRKPPSQVEAEILSSNSKPVPASPNAESTAISGHADGEDMDLEKERGEFQITQSDPFGGQRKAQKDNRFLRRLTGEETWGDRAVQEVQCYSTTTKTGIYDGSDIDQASPAAKSHQIPQQVPWLRKEPIRTSVAKPTGDKIARFAAANKPEVRSRGKGRENTGYPDHIHPQLLQETTNLQASLPPQPKPDQHINICSGSKPQSDYNRTSTRVALERLATPTEVETGMEILEIGNSILARPQHVVDDTQADDAVEELDGINLDAETTLINNNKEGNTNFEPRASLIQFCSSPPVRGCPSSRSSTSAGHTPSSQPSLPTSEAEEMEWESSLQPHQRAIHDLLMRTSKRVLRHIVDNETAVTDIADVFTRDGEHVLNTLLQQHENDYDRVFHDMEDKAKGLKKGLETSLKYLAEERSRINAMN